VPTTSTTPSSTPAERPTAPAAVPAAVPAPTPRDAGNPPTEASGANAAAEARAGMQRAIASYVDAIEARNVGAMQRAFPALPDDARRKWENLFRVVKKLEARAVGLQIGPPDGDAGTAELGLAVSFPHPETKRPCTQTTQLRMRLTRAGSTWRIADQTQLGNSASPGCG
jgi:hypothetical protein